MTGRYTGGIKETNNPKDRSKSSRIYSEEMQMALPAKTFCYGNIITFKELGKGNTSNLNSVKILDN